MKAKELFEVVKDVPEGARPKWIKGWNFERGYVLLQVPTMGTEPTVTDVFLWPDQAELMFIASMTLHLIGEGYHSFNYVLGDNDLTLELYDHVFRVQLDGSDRVQSTTRLLATACIAIAKEIPC